MQSDAEDSGQKCGVLQGRWLLEIGQHCAYVRDNLPRTSGKGMEQRRGIHCGFGNCLLHAFSCGGMMLAQLVLRLMVLRRPVVMMTVAVLFLLLG